MTDDERIAGAAAAVLGAQPDRIERLHGGANNVVVRVEAGGRTVVAKLYFQHSGDPRDRLGTEFEMLSFLWRRGIRSIPEPLAMNRELGVGVFAFIAGMHVVPPVTRPDADELIELLASMHEAGADGESGALPVASDASFDIRGRMTEIERRLGRLRAASDEDVRAFVKRELGTTVEAVCKWVARAADVLEVDLDRECAPKERMLSPGDIGFHNVLRAAGGRLCFLDFEYSGWDDTAQVLAQACLAPELPLPAALHVPVLRDLLDRFGPGAAAERVRLLYPLLALKWSLIVLNDTLAVDAERRVFAGVASERRIDVQVDKSRGLLDVARAASGPAPALDALLPPRARRALASR
jgi:hypothetical protein